ncbi:MAG: hypothetical protein OXN21_10675 [Chloroflexota bacterium]|nr:hypothetical protein [Chloroflexota bacterium]
MTTSSDDREGLEYLAGQIHALTVALAIICSALPGDQKGQVADLLAKELDPDNLLLPPATSDAATGGFINRLEMIVDALRA